MKLHFVGGKVSEVELIKETKKYMTVCCSSNGVKYRVDKETGAVQDGTYHRTIKGLYIEK